MIKSLTKPIALIGLSGTGKTTIGINLAKKLSLNFYDTDLIIEAESNSKISDIFENKGENFFRDLETKSLKEISNFKSPYILSTGGGIVTRPENLTILLHKFFVVKIHCDLDVLTQRILDDETRPLTKDNAEEKIKILFTQRDALYNKAHISIDSTSGQVEEISNNIIKNLVKLNDNRNNQS
jgi:shikimate kinase